MGIVHRVASHSGLELTREPMSLDEVALRATAYRTAITRAASVMIAAGANVKALSTFMGHASITITLDRYGHLLPGSIQEAAGLLDAFLERPRDDGAGERTGRAGEATGEPR